MLYFDFGFNHASLQPQIFKDPHLVYWFENFCCWIYYSTSLGTRKLWLFDTQTAKNQTSLHSLCRLVRVFAVCICKDPEESIALKWKP